MSNCFHSLSLSLSPTGIFISEKEKYIHQKGAHLCLFSRRKKKKNFHFISILAKSPFRNWKEKGLYFLHIFYRKHFLVLCHGLGFHTLVAGRMEMDMTVETSWLWNPDSKISRKMRKVWGTLNDSWSNNLWILWGDFEMAANATWLWPASCTL